MKFRELILWVLIIFTLILCIGNIYFTNYNLKIIKIITETQNYILELIDVRNNQILKISTISIK